MNIPFYKYQGTGNDFVVIDNRLNSIQLTQQQIKHICDRRFGIGADGLMMLQLKEGFDFEMKYYNSDGKEGSMCGNGGRCLTRFAYDIGIHKNKYHFIATDGEHFAETDEQDWIRLQMKDVNSLSSHNGNMILDTGSPHYVKEVDDIESLDIVADGRSIRYSKQFEAEGINVNFVQPTHGKLHIRTYERGVEDETYSCGTGVTACALVFAHNERGFNRVEIQTKGGNLAIEFEKLNEHSFTNIWLCGPARQVYKGNILI